ncbi:hypothetical protein [Actinocrispum sp. NPDC049592]|uniref:hypothetical protein n=1 Tax=Actinocrispum sp. NPDC049592 TaxID=3154835 RepID=UPI00343DBC88
MLVTTSRRSNAESPSSRRRIVCTTIAATLAFGASTFAAAPAAVANPSYLTTDGDIPSPNNGLDEPGAGARITNKPFGYYLGRIMTGSTFTQVGGRFKGHYYGRLTGAGTNMCGWLHRSARGARMGSAKSSCSAATANHMWQRTHVGKRFSAPAGTKGTSGAPTTINADAGKDCRLYYNYFTGTDFQHGSLRDPADQTYRAGGESKQVDYRFVTLDGKAAVVRDATYGWGFVRPECLTMRDPTTNAVIPTYNDPDTGAPQF